MIEGSNCCDEFEWDDLCAEVTGLMRSVRGYSGRWRATVSGFGWRGVDGQSGVIEAVDGAGLLFAILPNTDCRFKVWRGRGGWSIMVDNAHHDKPCGGEVYVIRAVR